MIVVIENHLLGMNRVDVKENLAAGLHDGIGLGELLNHKSRLHIVLIYRVADIHLESP